MSAVPVWSPKLQLSMGHLLFLEICLAAFLKLPLPFGLES